MKKKRKKKGKYIFRNIEYDTFKEMKTYAYFNMEVDIKDKGFKIADGEIIKEYIFKKQERRLICEKIYDRDEELKKEFEKRQLKLFTDG